MVEGQGLEHESKPINEKTSAASTDALIQEAYLVADAGQQNRAQYGKVAPLAQDAVNGNTRKNGAHDPFFVPNENNQQDRAPYQPSGNYPGHENTQPIAKDGQQNSQYFDPNNPPKFSEHHSDKIRDPNQRYQPSDIGQQVAEEVNKQSPGKNQKKDGHTPGMKPGEAWKFAWEDGDVFSPRVGKTIDNRGQKGISRDTTALNNALFAGMGGISAPAIIYPLTRPIESPKAGSASLSAQAEPGWWTRNFNPAYQNSADLVKPIQVKHTQAFTDFDNLTTKLADVAKGSDEAANLAKEKLEFLKTRAAGFGHAEVADAATFLNGKAFTKAEIEILKNRATAGIAINEAALTNQQRLAQVAENAPGWAKRAGSGVMGAFFSGSAVGLDRKATTIGIKDEEAQAQALHESFNLSQFTAPLAFALAPKYKWAAAPLAGVASSQVFDRGLKSIGITAPDRWNAASGVYDGWNAFSTAASLGIAEYTPNPWAKATVVGIGQAIPLIVHAYQDNIGGDLKGNTEKARESVFAEHKERSYDSLQEVSSGMRGIIEKKEDWVIDAEETSYKALRSTAQGGRWEKLTTEEKLLGLRDDASISGALANAIVDKGTRMADKTSEPRYVLEGLDLDVGGRGLHYMLRARDSADKAAQLTDGILANNSDPNNEKIAIKGSEPGANEPDDLRKFAGEFSPRIQDLLDGKHDMRKALDGITAEAKVLEKEDLKTFEKYIDKLAIEYNERGRLAREAAIRADQTGDTATLQRANIKTEEYAKVVAKLYRDQALVYMAWAKAKMADGDDGGGAYDYLIDDGFNRQNIFPNGQKKNYNGAQGTLKIAEKYNPSNPDMQELGEIFTELTKEMVEKKKVQLTDPSNNILGYHDDFHRSK
jgi:hypothetical protein